MNERFSVVAAFPRVWKEVLFWGKEAWLSILTILMTGVMARGLGLANNALKPIKHPPYPEYALPIFIGIVIVLYYMKYTRKVSYGITEIIIAVVGFLLALRQSLDHFDNWTFTLSVAAAAYVAVRGLDNVVTGARTRYAKVAE